MDRERFGRALGRGARLAAQTAYEAVDAATSAPPAQAARRNTGIPAKPADPQRSFSQVTRANRAATAAPVTLEAAPLLRAAKAAGQGFASPLRRASRALWHEFTGCFFALFAFSFGVGVWHTRSDAFSPLASARHRFAAFCLLTVLFGYFSVSSFLRARKTSAG